MKVVIIYMMVALIFLFSTIRVLLVIMENAAQEIHVDYTLGILIAFFAFMTIYMARGAMIEYHDYKKDSE